MTLDNPNEKMKQVRIYIQEEEADEALNLLNTIIEENDLLDAHRLRINILLPELKQPQDLRLSLNIVSSFDPTTYESLQTNLDKAVHKRLNELQNLVSEATSLKQVRPYLTDIDEMLVLSDLFPTIHLVRGLAYITAARIIEVASQESSSPYDKLRQLLASELGEVESIKTQRKELESQAPQQTEWNEIAVLALQTALEAFANDHPLCGETYEMLGTLHKTMGEYVKALDAYNKAVVHGRFLDDKIEQLTSEVAHIGQKLILDHVDILIKSEQFDQATNLLNVYRPTSLPHSWRLRMAEIALLQGDVKTAEQLYQNLLESNLNNDESKG